MQQSIDEWVKRETCGICETVYFWGRKGSFRSFTGLANRPSDRRRTKVNMLELLEIVACEEVRAIFIF
jgi:hypothetical protein